MMLIATGLILVSGYRLMVAWHNRNVEAIVFYCVILGLIGIWSILQ
jgi:hypothetical protein